MRLPSRQMSAAVTLTGGQRRTAAAIALVALAIGIASPVGLGMLVVAGSTALYLAILGYRLLTFRDAMARPSTVHVADDEARAIPDSDLPIYTVLVPAYREPEVIGRLLGSIDELEYPRDRLDVRLLLEEDDPETMSAARAALARRPAAYVTVVTIPVADPRTKPKACNIGLAGAQGEMVTIYDVEDRPDPLQLRRAVVAFRRVPAETACLQARLSYHNADQNLITRWFTAEYELWFGLLLPGLVARNAPLPLGGTSNHFRRETLVALGGWDAHNVTEDADLGIRLHRLGYRTLVLDSTTLEEANSDVVNWIKQRSRWYKGYMQTWLVHMRNPRELWRELGPAGFVGFNLFVGGTPILALLNPLFWALGFLWFVARPSFILDLYPAWLYYPSMVSFAVGNFAFYYAALVAARATGQPKLAIAAILSPVYWMMMSIAAIKALVQLIGAPSFWEKTAHGLDVARHPEHTAA
jgi:cellulose synthase/poly-beta-1,6-N-acetylglucosamine synthase-like glycosyltransferase